MKKYLLIVLILVTVLSQLSLADDLFEHKEQKMVSRITSYQRLNGELIDFSNVNNELYKLSEQASKTKMKKNYIYHRLNNDTYQSEDLRNWKKITVDRPKKKLI